MKLIFIGSVYPRPILEKAQILGSNIDFAAHTFQCAQLSGFEKKYPNRTIISAPSIDPFPKIRKVLWERATFSHNGESERNNTMVGMLNLPGIKMLSKFVRLFFEIRRRTTNKNEQYLAIIYSCVSPALLAFYLNRNRFVKSCLIVPDMPQFVSSKTGLLFKWAKSIERWLTNPAYKAIQSYVLFSPYMTDLLPVNSKPWIHVEGIFMNDVGTETTSTSTSDNVKTILYTGTLQVRYGIVDLLKAFHLISKPDYQLLICGKGDGENIVELYAKQDKRIQYLGIKSMPEVRSLQKKVTLLVNPRHSNEEYTKYSFPSKTIEYMASGTPTLMSKLSAIPEEYFPYLFFFEDESIEGMSQRMVQICEMEADSLKSFGRSASQFIFDNKNYQVQANRIIELIEATDKRINR